MRKTQKTHTTLNVLWAIASHVVYVYSSNQYCYVLCTLIAMRCLINIFNRKPAYTQNIQIYTYSIYLLNNHSKIKNTIVYSSLDSNLS